MSAMENAQQLQHSQQLRRDEQPSYKNELQRYTQRAGLDLPMYYTKNIGVQHASQFKCSVTVDNETYESPNTFPQKKAAEQDAAKYALEGIAKKRLEIGSSIINMNTTFCKSIVNELAAKLQVERPKYNVVQMQQGPIHVFVSTLEFKGVSYTGGLAKTKRDAEQSVAHDALISILDDSEVGTALLEILKSKAKLISSTQLSKDPTCAAIRPEVGSNLGGDALIPTSREEQFKDASKSCALQTEGAPGPSSIQNLTTPPMQTCGSGSCDITAASHVDVPQLFENPITPVQVSASVGRNVTAASQAIGFASHVPPLSQNPSNPPTQAFASVDCNVASASQASGPVFPMHPSSQNTSTPPMQEFPSVGNNVTFASQADGRISLGPCLSKNPITAPVQVSTNEGCKITPASQVHGLDFHMAPPQNQSGEREIMYVPQVGLQSNYLGREVASAPQAGGPLYYMPPAPELPVTVPSIQGFSVAQAPQSTKRSNRAKRHKANKKARKANQMGGQLCSTLT